MRRIVLIDGENLVYGLRHLLGEDSLKTERRFVEKGVDVGLAVRIVTEAGPQTEIVVVSADTDLLPAFKAAKKAGARLIHIGYEYRPVASLGYAADATRNITIPLAQKYRGQNEFK